MKHESTSRWRGRCAVGLLLVCSLLIGPAIASAAGRVALVVGNGTYTHIGQLPNPGNDASDVSSALRRLGFQVTVVFDANRAELTDALREFTRRSAGAAASLVFYAGHGIEMDGVNYLLPVDARLERDTDVRYETVTLDDVLAATVGAGLRLVILDACRNNPLARSMQRTVATRSVSQGSFGELNEGLLGEQTLVAYSAAAGTTAADGTGRNSPYTTALLEYLQEPLEIGVLFRRVRARVLELTGQRQRPHEYQSLLTEHFLSGSFVPTPVVGGDAATDASRIQQENLFWQTIAGSTNSEDFRAYLAQFPNGTYARLATNRLATMQPLTNNASVETETPSDRPSMASAPEPSVAGGGFSASRLAGAAGPRVVCVPEGLQQLDGPALRCGFGPSGGGSRSSESGSENQCGNKEGRKTSGSLSEARASRSRPGFRHLDSRR